MLLELARWLHEAAERRERTARLEAEAKRNEALERVEATKRELADHIATIEELDVARLRLGEAAHRPREMHEVRLHRLVQQVHPDLVHEVVRLARVAAGAGQTRKLKTANQTN